MVLGATQFQHFVPSFVNLLPGDVRVANMIVNLILTKLRQLFVDQLAIQHSWPDNDGPHTAYLVQIRAYFAHSCVLMSRRRTRCICWAALFSRTCLLQSWMSQNTHLKGGSPCFQQFALALAVSIRCCPPPTPTLVRFEGVQRRPAKSRAGKCNPASKTCFSTPSSDLQGEPASATLL